FQQMQPHLNPIGYKIGLELIVVGFLQRVDEIPIRFCDRLHGESKLTLQEQWNYLRHLRRLYAHRFPRSKSPRRFVAVGCLGPAVDLAAFASIFARTALSAGLSRLFSVGGPAPAACTRKDPHGEQSGCEPVEPRKAA